MSLITEGLGDGDGSISASSITTPQPNVIVVTFSDGPLLTGDALDPSKWLISIAVGVVPIVQSVSVSGTHVTLQTSVQYTGASYVLHLPNGILDAGSAGPLAPPYDLPFTGNGSSPTLLMARALDSTTLEVIFSEVVDVADALDRAKYTVSGGIVVLAVTQISGQIYRLTTSEQSPATVYTVTVTGVRDLAGNPS